MKNQFNNLEYKIRDIAENIRMHAQDSISIINAGLEPGYVLSKETRKELAIIEGFRVEGFKEKLFDFMQKYEIFDTYSAYSVKKNNETYRSFIRFDKEMDQANTKYSEIMNKYATTLSDKERSYREIYGSTGYMKPGINDNLAAKN